MAELFATRLNRLSFFIGSVSLLFLDTLGFYLTLLIPILYFPYNILLVISGVSFTLRRSHDIGYGNILGLLCSFLITIHGTYTLARMTLIYANLGFIGYVEGLDAMLSIIVFITWLPLILIKGQKYDNQFGQKPPVGLQNALVQLVKPAKNQTPNFNSIAPK